MDKQKATEALETIKATLRKVPGFTMDSAVEMFSLFGVVESALKQEDVAKPTVEPK